MIARMQETPGARAARAVCIAFVCVVLKLFGCHFKVNKQARSHCLSGERACVHGGVDSGR